MEILRTVELRRFKILNVICSPTVKFEHDQEVNVCPGLSVNLFLIFPFVAVLLFNSLEITLLNIFPIVIKSYFPA